MLSKLALCVASFPGSVYFESQHLVDYFQCVDSLYPLLLLYGVTVAMQQVLVQPAC